MSKPVIRCSSLDRVISCNGSLTLTKASPKVPDEDDEVRFQGNMGHFLIANTLIKEQGAVGELEPPEVPEDYIFPDRISWVPDNCVNVALDQIPGDYAMVVEQGFAWEFDRFILSGHIDVCGISAEATDVVAGDWKLGNKPQDPAHANWQFLGYLVLLYQAFPSLKRGTFFMYQPLATLGDYDDRLSEVTVEDFPEMAKYLESEINKALDNPMELNTGVKQCQYCPALLAARPCPAAKQELDKFMKYQLTDEQVTFAGVEMTDGELGDLYQSSRILYPSMTEALKKRIDRRLEHVGSIVSDNGKTITGSQKGGRWDVASSTDLIELAEQEIGGDDVDEWAPREVKVPKVIDALAEKYAAHEKTKKAKQKVAKDLFKERFGHLAKQQTTRWVRIHD